METTNNKTERAAELLPCAFCGEPAEWINKVLFDGHYYIRCSNGECHVTIKADRQDKAIGFWNRRIVREPEKVKEAIPYSHFQYHLMTLRNNLYNALPTGDSSLFEFIKVIKSHIEEIDRLLKNGVIGEPLVKENGQYIMGYDDQASQFEILGPPTTYKDGSKSRPLVGWHSDESLGLKVLNFLNSLPVDTDTKTKE